MKTLFTLFLTFCLTASLIGQADTISGSFVHNDSLRSYLLYVPAAYDGTEDWPLVINYHGFNNTAADQMYVSQMNPIADTANFLIVYPQGLLVNNPFLGFSAPGWNVDGSLSDNDDVSFTNHLIDQMLAGYAVDPARIYVTGWSMGANISFQIGCDLADRIAAVGGVANQMADSQIENCTPGRPFSALLIHGTADPIVPFNGDGALFSSAYNTPAFWAGNNNCSPDSLVTELDDIVTTDTSTVTLIEYTDCETGSEVMFYRINGGGHSWPGGGALPAFLGKVNRDINASAEIWNFFKRNPHPNPPTSTEFGGGDTLMLTTTLRGVEREYILYIPEAYDGSKAWPLVFNLHGFGITAEQQMILSNMNTVADTGHFLVLYPQGSEIISSVPGLAPGGPGWTIGYSAVQEVYFPANDVDDVEFISHLIDQVGLNYNLDPARVYVCGWSNGGIMSTVLGCKLGSRIAAIGSVAGTLLRGYPCQPSRPIPVLQINGTIDPQSPYETSTPPGDLLAVEEWLTYWIGVNTCSTNPTTTPLADLDTGDASTVELVVWNDCAEETIHYKIESGGHSWPGGVNLFPFLGNYNLDISAGSEIWNFFNRNVHPGLSTSTKEVAGIHEEGVKIYPNPFDGTLTIDLELSRNQAIFLSLYNSLGQPIGNTIRQDLPSGSNRLQWTIKDASIASGVYYLSIQTGTEQIVRPVFYNSKIN